MKISIRKSLVDDISHMQLFYFSFNILLKIEYKYNWRFSLKTPHLSFHFYDSYLILLTAGFACRIFIFPPIACLKKSDFSSLALLSSSNFFWKITFLKKLFFQKSNTPHYLHFLESYFFRVATFRNAFSEELLFHSCGSFLQLHFLFM